MPEIISVIALAAVLAINAATAFFGLYVLVVRAPERRLLFAAIMLTSAGCLLTLMTTATVMWKHPYIVDILTHDWHWMGTRLMQALGALSFHCFHLSEARNRKGAVA